MFSCCFVLVSLAHNSRHWVIIIEEYVCLIHTLGSAYVRLSMALHKAEVSLLPMFWGYHSLALSCWWKQWGMSAGSHCWGYSPGAQSCKSLHSLQWCHNEPDGVSNHQPHDCLRKPLFRRRSKKTSKLHVTGLCEGNSLVTSEFHAQRASNMENVSIWSRHHAHLKISSAGVSIAFGNEFQQLELIDRARYTPV